MYVKIHQTNVILPELVSELQDPSRIDLKYGDESTLHSGHEDYLTFMSI